MSSSKVFLRHGRRYICLDCRRKAALNISHTPASFRAYSTEKATKGTTINISQEDKFVKLRTHELGGSDELQRLYPRWSPTLDAPLSTCKSFNQRYQDRPDEPSVIPNGSSLPIKETVYGRVTSRRKHSASLTFLDIGEESYKIQGVLEVQELERNGFEGPVSKHVRGIKRGDWIALTGHPHRTSTSELSLLLTSPPRMLAPALQPIEPYMLQASPNPDSNINKDAQDPDPTTTSTTTTNLHISHPVANPFHEVSLIRHTILQTLRSFFSSRDFIEVTTPILASRTAGASAKPFITTSSALNSTTTTPSPTNPSTPATPTKLTLRISPELSLKRLLIQSSPRVFEIGPVFRNEGIDASHNPEFTICEFYAACTSLPNLLAMTEQLLREMARAVARKRTDAALVTIPPPDAALLQEPPSGGFTHLPFIPTLTSLIRTHIPTFRFPRCTTANALSASQTLLSVYTACSITPPAHHSLPALLDGLAAHFLEPLARARPTWITAFPACTAPLAKSYVATFAPSGEELHGAAEGEGQKHEVSARAELYLAGREIVNCYEEENSPFAQRDKLLTQQLHNRARYGRKDGAEERGEDIDTSYVHALTHGLPPAGGWGAGVDRLVMHFTGRRRIADVLPFGGLGNVVALGRGSSGDGGEGVEREG